MKTIILLIAVLFYLAPATAQSSFDTTGGRFLLPVFDSVQIWSDVLYARSPGFSGQSQDLHMDVFAPFADSSSLRPVLVMAHGGSFLQGSKADLAATCRSFARKGYVAVSIQYRLGFSTFTPSGATQTIVRATQDMKNAIRFLRKSATTGNPYRLHPEFVFAGGVSAGAITALHAAYMDRLAEIPPGQNLPSLDSLHNSGQIPGFDWRFKAVLNIAGGVGDTSWMEAGNIPVCSFHGTADGVVPYETGSLAGAITLFGSSPITRRARNLGIRTDLRPFPGAGHDYSSVPGSVDTTETRIARFLLPFLAPAATSNLTLNQEPDIQFRPHQAGWEIQFPERGQVVVSDLQGRLLNRSETLNGRLVLRGWFTPVVVVAQGADGRMKRVLLPARP